MAVEERVPETVEHGRPAGWQQQTAFHGSGRRVACELDGEGAPAEFYELGHGSPCVAVPAVRVGLGVRMDSAVRTGTGCVRYGEARAYEAGARA